MFYSFHWEKKVVCPAGERTTIISTMFRNYPEIFVLHIVWEHALDGKWIVSTWFPFTDNKAIPLHHTMSFEKSRFDIFYRVDVLPEHDVVVELEKRWGLSKFFTYFVNFCLLVLVGVFLYVVLYMIMMQL
jgi:hypothetical protein